MNKHRQRRMNANNLLINNIIKDADKIDCIYLWNEVNTSKWQKWVLMFPDIKFHV